MGQGDKTVPFKSAIDLDGESYQVGTGKHSSLSTTNQKEVVFALTGEMPTDYINKNIYNGLSTLSKVLFIRLLSPIDVQVTDPSGKNIGKDFNTDTTINEIPGATYSGFNGPTEFIIIPNPLDGEYNINVQGTDNGGEYGLELTYLDDEQEKTLSFYNTIIPGQIVNFVSDFNQDDLENWQLEPTDTDAPIITFTPNQNSYLKPETLEIQVEDLESGLEQLEIKLDGQLLSYSFVNGATSTSVSIDMNDYHAGNHVLDILAKDKSDNLIELQKDFQISVEINQVITDAYSIWYKDGATKNAVIDKLVKIRNNYKELATTSNPDYVKNKIISKINELKVMLKSFKKAGLIYGHSYRLLIYDLDYLLSKL
jgi:hypothetical protein